LWQIEENTRTRLANFTEGKLELSAAVATKRSEYVTGQALRMYANERCNLFFKGAAKIATNQRNRLFLRAAAGKTVNREPSIASRQVRLRNLPHRGTFFVGRLARLWFSAHRKRAV